MQNSECSRSMRSLTTLVFWTGLIAMALTPGDVYGYGLFQTLQHAVTGFDSLDEAQAAALSPDGRHLYVGGREAIMVMERDPVTGALLPLQTVQTSSLDIFFIDHLAMSPDGLHLYAGSATFSALAVFARDPNSGLLTHVQSLFESDVNVEGLNTLFDLEVSLDGRHVYTLSPLEDEIGVFARSSTDGSLTTVQVVNDDGSVPEMQFPITLALSPDGNQVVVGDRLTGLLIFERATIDGRLTFRSQLAGEGLGFDRPQDMVFSPDGEYLYVSGRTTLNAGPGVVALRRSGEEGFTPLQILSGLSAGEGLVIDGDGAHLYLTASSQVTVLSRSSQGELTLIQQLTNGVDGVEGLGGSFPGVLDASGRHLYVPAFADEAVAIFERQGDGRLTFLDAVFDGEGSTVDGLLDIVALHATGDGSDVYVLGGENRVLAQFRRSADGQLQAGPILSLLDVGLDDFLTVRRLLATPTDSHLIVLDEFGQAWIFRRGEGGQLEFLRQHLFENIFPDRLVFDPQGRFLFVGSTLNVMGFEFDPNSGQLTPIFVPVEGNRAFQWMAMDPQGRFLFGGLSENFGEGPSVVYTYRWNADERRLIQIASQTHASFGDQLTGLAVSPDGRYVITTGRGTPEAGLSVFEVNALGGGLSHIQTLGPSVGNAGLDQPTLGSIDPSGTRLVAINDDRFPTITSSFLTRDPATGLLEILEQRTTGDSNGPSSIRSYRDLAWAPDGQQFYAFSSDSLYAFDESLEGASCLPSPQVLCLGEDGRFRVEVQWTDFVGQQGIGTKVVESGDSGLFWFFDDANWEMLVKVVDGCGFNDHHWVFAAATTNVQYTLTVTDTLRGVEAVYRNPLGVSADAITDTEALDSCP